MSVYVDASAFLKLYLEEQGSQEARRLMSSDAHWITARHTEVEVRRNIARSLGKRDLDVARRLFSGHWSRTDLVELDEGTCAVAADIAEATGARTLDALHLGAAHRVGGGSLPFLTYDRRQAQVARSLGWSVLGV